ncbi:MAG: hypothetical protein ACRDVW_09665 [Acidimicrobiales bacterium]
MARFLIDGQKLCLRLNWMEKLEAAHANVRVPLAAVSSVRSVAAAWPELRGIRAPGTGIPGVIAVGTRRGPFGKDFAAVHGKGSAVVVECENGPYQRIVATHEHSEDIASMIRGRTPR